MKPTQDLNLLQIDLQEVQMDCKWLRDMWSSLKWWWYVKILWSCISSKFFGLAFRVGERSTWVWIAVITVSHERMVICIHFYIWIFSDIFTPDSAQTHWFRIFLSTFLRVRFCPDFCATTATSLYEIQMKFWDGDFRKLLCFANSPLWLHGQKLKPKLEASCVCCRLFTRIQLIWRMVK